MKTWCLFGADMECDCATKAHLCAVTKNSNFQLCANGAKIVTLLYNGYVFFSMEIVLK